LFLLHFCFLEENFASVTKGAVTPRQFSSETCIATAVAVEIARVSPPLVTTCLATKNCFASWSKSNTFFSTFHNVVGYLATPSVVYVFCTFSLNALSKTALQVGEKNFKKFKKVSPTTFPRLRRLQHPRPYKR